MSILRPRDLRRSIYSRIASPYQQQLPQAKVYKMSTTTSPPSQEPYVSPRALANINTDPPTAKLHAIRSHCFHNQYDSVSNPDGIVALAIAENKLMRDEIVQHINTHMNITPLQLTYGHGPAGSIELRGAIASFVSEVFKPSMAIDERHVAVCNGAGSAVDNLSFCLGEPGDGILVGRPLYVGFFPDIEARAK